jgi:hypothetical protein
MPSDKISSIYSLVGGDWNMAGIFPIIIGHVIIPTGELIFFQRGRSTTNQ